MTLMTTGLLGLLLFFLSVSIPKTFHVSDNPIEAPRENRVFGGGLPGFDSPYIGHTGSWDGKGGAMFGASKNPDLDQEVAMGLSWTFMCLNWSTMEPDGPVDLSQEIPTAWQSVDQFVIECKKRGLNILMQAPVVGGNAGGPPEWAGRREPDRSAPENMKAAADFAEKLARRYTPGGTLASEQEWGEDFGVRAWELDNEPESYRTNWKGQAGDYAEFATRIAQRIKSVDPEAVIVMAATANGAHGGEWLEQTLDAHGLAGSPSYRENQKPYSIGPATDAVSFHLYEGLDTFFSGEDRTIGKAFQEVRTLFEQWESKAEGFEYERKTEYWHTEGNFDFIGMLSEERRAAWRWQFFTRAFASGIRKVAVMDAKPLEQIAVKRYIEVLPAPFPMVQRTRATVVQGDASVFHHHSGKVGQRNQHVWIAWADAGKGPATVEIRANAESATVFTPDGNGKPTRPIDGVYRIQLEGDEKMATPKLIVENVSMQLPSVAPPKTMSTD